MCERCELAADVKLELSRGGATRISNICSIGGTVAACGQCSQDVRRRSHVDRAKAGASSSQPATMMNDSSNRRPCGAAYGPVGSNEVVEPCDLTS